MLSLPRGKGRSASCSADARAVGHHNNTGAWTLTLASMSSHLSTLPNGPCNAASRTRWWAVTHGHRQVVRPWAGNILRRERRHRGVDMSAVAVCAAGLQHLLSAVSWP